MEKKIKLKDEKDDTIYELKLQPDEPFSWKKFFLRLVLIVVGMSAAIIAGKYLAGAF